MITYRIEHDMDAERVAALRAEFEMLSQQDEDVAVDIDRVRFIDSSGVGALVFLFKRLRARDRNLVLLNANGQPKRLFVQLRLTFLFAREEKSSAA
ncbi:MAG: STAS domain-containing protein [Beijerinckiaceae bacterium]|nr:STAS domain-containing protein [Beijerinckiaceae bacterium]